MPGFVETLARRRRRAGAIPLAVVVLWGLPGIVPGVGAQEPPPQEASEREQRCDLVRSNFVRSIVTANGARINYISGPVALECADGLRVRADSVVEFTATRFRQLYGGVVMDGPETRMRAQRVHHFADAGRIQAWHDVEVFEKADSMRIVGDTLLLLQANQFRAEDRLSVWGGDPYAVVRLRQAGEAPDTAAAASAARDTVHADRIHLRGRSRFAAAGSVRIVGDEVTALSDSADFARDEGSLALIPEGEGSMSRVRGPSYDLTSRSTDIRMGPGGIREVEAREEAVLSGEDIRLTAPVVRIFLTAGEIERLVAVEMPAEDDGEATAGRGREGAPGGAVADSVAPVRPEALAEDFQLRADSIEVMAPAQRLETVFAAGAARGVSLGRDSLNTDDTPEIARTDWIEGDSILAVFVPTDSVPADTAASDSAVADTAAADSTRARFRLERLVATGSARSLYRLERRDTTAAAPDTAADSSDTAAAQGPDTAVAEGSPPADTAAPADTAGIDRRLAIHYVTGRKITIHLRDGEVEEMEVEGQTRGIYLEPGARPRPVPADTTAAPGGVPPAGDDPPPPAPGPGKGGRP